MCDFGVSGELIDSMAGTFTGTSFYMAVRPASHASSLIYSAYSMVFLFDSPRELVGKVIQSVLTFGQRGCHCWSSQQIDFPFLTKLALSTSSFTSHRAMYVPFLALQSA